MWLIKYELNADNTIKNWRQVWQNDGGALSVNFSPDEGTTVFTGVDKVVNGQFVQGDRASYLQRIGNRNNIVGQIADIDNWFAWYDNQVSQAQRAQRTGSVWNATDGTRTYNTIAELDADANNKQHQIRTLKAQLQG